MAFDKPTRNRLAAFVAEARRLITDEFTQQFQSLYGIAETSLTPLEQLAEHRDDAELAVAGLLRERIEYLVKTHPGDKAGLKAAVDRLAREQAFTVLNRLAAVRMAEKRGLIAESVGNGYQSKGFKVFEQVARSGLGEIYQRYRRYLFCLFDELAIDLGVLFDRRSPQGLLFPRENTLLDLLNLLNAPELEPLWQEDETIGWIYQYYNDPAERKKMREESAAPRNSRELAVRNQFFTPRYVVEFLTDNTLGRIWYEMTRGETRLKEQCRYLVRRPKEVFLLGAKYFGSSAQQAILDACAGSFSGLMNLAEITWDDLQCLALAIDGYHLAQSLGLGDCGDLAHAKTHEYRKTGKWNGDAAELWCCLFFMQRRYRNDGTTPEGKDWQEISTLFEALRHQLTQETEGLTQEEILAQPVFIPPRPEKDPRQLRMLDPACGSMHFGLYAFDLYEVIYEEAWDRGVESLRADFAERDALLCEIPRLIIEHNIHGIDIDPRAVQIAGLSLWLRAQRCWQQQRLLAQKRPQIHRSNIVCAEPMPGDKAMLRDFIASQFTPEEQPAFTFLLERVFDRMTLAGEAGSLLKIEEEISEAVREAKRLWKKGPQYRPGYLFSEAIPKQPEQLQLDLSGISDEGFWETAEEQIYTSLQAYAEQAESGGYQRRLFANDAARGFSFIDICRKRYDVALMNPPFGLPVEGQIEWLKARYSNAYVDLYSAMVSRGLQFSPSGLVGCITSRSFMFAKTLTAWRETVFLPQVNTLTDLGSPVMDDAMVESCAFALKADQDSSIVSVFDCRATDDKDALLHETIISKKCSYLVDKKAIKSILGGKFLYSIGGNVRKLLYKNKEKLGESVLLARQGLKSFNDFRFLRLHFEVPTNKKGRENGWEPITRGGGNQLFYTDISSLVLSENNGQEMAAVNFNANGQTAQSRQASRHYRQAGATYTWRADSFKVAALPSGVIIGGKGPAVLPLQDASPSLIVGLLSSGPMRALVELQANANQYETGILESLPSPYLSSDIITLIENVSKAAIKKCIDVGISLEDSTQFWGFHIKQSLEEVKRSYQEKATELSSIIDAYLSELDVVVGKSLGLTINDVNTLIEAAEIKNSIKFETFGDFCGGNLISYNIGSIFGRWDIRCTMGERQAPQFPDPFASLPICPPGMLKGKDGLPLSPEAGRQLYATSHYPLDIAWDGILVDDPGHPLDLEHRLREVFTVLWHDRAEAIEQEACELLGIKSLRDYFRKPSGFFADHLKRYSKSRRQAPIYWPLSTAKGSYTLWIYYHRLNDQTLHTALADFVDPKIKDIRAEISLLRESNNNRNRLEELLDLEGELLDFQAEIERIIKLPWQPNLNDGVLITAAPLWRLFRLPKWQKDLKACWDKLEKGEYDWAHLAYSIWPKRVEEVCKKDRSIAIAHGLEHLCQVEPPKPKAKRGRKKAE